MKKIAMLLMLGVMIVSGAKNVYADVKVSTEEELRKELNKDTTSIIRLTKNITVTSEIEVHGKHTIKPAVKCDADVCISRGKNYKGYLFEIKKGNSDSLSAELTLNGTNNSNGDSVYVIVDGRGGINGYGGNIKSNAALINVGEDCVLNLRGCDLRNNYNNAPKDTEKNVYSGGAIQSHGTVNMSGGSRMRIYNNKSVNGKGGGIALYGRASLHINSKNAKIFSNNAQMGGGIYNTGQSQVIVSSGEVYSNVAKKGDITGNGCGGAAATTSMDDRAFVLSSSAKIYNNTAEERGGGICVGQSGTAQIMGGSIYNNTAQSYGGGIHITSTASEDALVMIDGNICANRGYNGGGINSFQNVQIIGGSITENVASNNGGGLNSTSAANMISQQAYIGLNQAKNGGGIYNKGIIRIRNSELNSNNAENGAGIYNIGMCETDGQTKITNNNATKNGGGICECGEEGEYKGIIARNEAKNGGGVYCKSERMKLGGKIYENRITENGHGSGVYISRGVECELSNIIIGFEEVKKHTEYTLGLNYKESEKIERTEQLYIASSANVVCNDNFFISGGKKNQNVKVGAITNYGILNMYGGVNVISEGCDESATILNKGEIYSNGSMLYVAEGYAIQGGSVTWNDGTVMGGAECGFYKVQNMVMNDGLIEGCGTGIFVGQNQKFEMYGGRVSDSLLSGLKNAGETLINSEDATICSNGTEENPRGGGIYNSGILNFEDGEVYENNAVEGGGIYNEGELTINGGIISRNVSEKNGSGIYQNGILEISGECKVHENNEVYLPREHVINIEGHLMLEDVVMVIVSESMVSGTKIAEVTYDYREEEYPATLNLYVLGVRGLEQENNGVDVQKRFVMKNGALLRASDANYELSESVGGKQYIILSDIYEVRYHGDEQLVHVLPQNHTKFWNEHTMIKEIVAEDVKDCFVCWNTKEDFSGTNYYPKEVYKNNEDIDLYAHIQGMEMRAQLNAVDRGFVVGEKVDKERVLQKVTGNKKNGDEVAWEDINIVAVESENTKLEADIFDEEYVFGKATVYELEIESDGAYAKFKVIVCEVPRDKDKTLIRAIDYYYLVNEPSLDEESKWNESELYVKLRNSLSKTEKSETVEIYRYTWDEIVKEKNGMKERFWDEEA